MNNRSHLPVVCSHEVPGFPRSILWKHSTVQNMRIQVLVQVTHAREWGGWKGGVRRCGTLVCSIDRYVKWPFRGLVLVGSCQWNRGPAFAHTYVITQCHRVRSLVSFFYRPQDMSKTPCIHEIPVKGNARQPKYWKASHAASPLGWLSLLVNRWYALGTFPSSQSLCGNRCESGKELFLT